MSKLATVDSGLKIFLRLYPENTIKLEMALSQSPISAIKLIRSWSGESFSLQEISKWVDRHI